MSLITDAMKLLNISSYTFTSRELKSAYFKQAVKCHPDKNNNSEKSTTKFQQLQDAYELLLTVAVDTEEDSKEDTSEYGVKSYDVETLIQLIRGMVSSKTVDSNILVRVLDKIVSIYTASPCTLVDGNKIKDICEILKTVIHIYNGPNKSFYEKLFQNIYSIIGCSKKVTISYELKPTIDDLLNDNVYKLTVWEKTHLVPLWYDECVYELDGNTELVVNCNPIITKDIRLDAENNVYMNVNIPFKSVKLDEPIQLVHIGKKTYTIYTNSLIFTQDYQTICLYNQGILKMTDDNFYSSKLRSNIYLQISLV
jgi:hypothetical protein